MLGNYSALLITMGDLERAEQMLEEGQAAYRRVMHQENSVILADLGLAALLRGQLDRAADLFAQSLEMEGKRERGSSRFVAIGLESFGWLATLTGQPRRAATLLGAAESLRETIGAPVPPAYRERFEMFLHKGQAQIDAAAWSTAWAQGRAMALDAAVELALTTGTTPEVRAEPASLPEAILSKRELEVLRLVVDGQSNAEIAETLFISPNTVANHVASIMNKLGVESRTAAATWAVRHGID
jgi:DNA-binding CsgD family transcriptional regulator